MSLNSPVRNNVGCRATTSLAAVAAFVLSITLVDSAPAITWEVNQSYGDAPAFKNCGVEVTGSAWIHSDDGGGGMGVAGGNRDTAVESGETIEFAFDEPAVAISFRSLLATGAQFFVEAFDAGGVSLGLRVSVDETENSISDLYDGQGISRFTLTSVDQYGVHFKSISYAEVGPVTIDFSRAGNSLTYVELDYCDTVFSSSNGVNVFSNFSQGGIGAEGGYNDFLTDQGETLSITFPYPVEELVFESLLFDLDADQQFGEAFLIAYDEQGGAIEILPIGVLSGTTGTLRETIDISALFSGALISSIDLVSSSDARRLDKVIYAPEPTGTSLLLAGILWFGMLGRARQISY